MYSEPGLGTTFKVYWPRSSRDVPLQVFTSEVTAPVTSASATVLLVEDEASVRQFSKRILDHAAIECWERSTETTPSEYSHTMPTRSIWL